MLTNKNIMKLFITANKTGKNWPRHWGDAIVLFHTPSKRLKFKIQNVENV